MTVKMSIFYQNSNLTQSKVHYSNARLQFCMNWALLSLRPILHLIKYSKRYKKLFSHDAPNEVLLIHQILNSSRPKVYYGDPRHQFFSCISSTSVQSPSLALRPLLYIRKNSKCGDKLETFFIKDNS